MTMNKQALMQSTVAIIIIIMLSAAVLFLFFWKFSDLFSDQADKDTCRASIELRSQQGLIGTATKLQIPLRCKTEYKCLTMGGKCPEGYTKINVKSQEDIQQQIAYAMYDCWWMMGEGKLDFFTESSWKTIGGVGTPEKSCLICSIITFDDKIKQQYTTIDIASYLSKEVIPFKNKTYLEYFADQTGVEVGTEVNAEKIFTENQYSVLFFGLKGGDFIDRLKADAELLGVGAAGSAVVIGPVATGKLVQAAFKLTPGLWKLVYLVPAVVQMGFEGWSQHVAAVYCDGAKEGCYIISLIPFNARTIGAQCSNIESIP